MRYLFLLLLLCYCNLTTAQNFNYPILKKQAKQINEVIPAQWKILDSVYGDLNNDTNNDIAIIMEYNLPINENRAYGDKDMDLIKEYQKPRILVAYFKDQKTGKYHLKLQNNHFILRNNEGGALGDPLLKMQISQNILNLAFQGGANWRWKLNYEFKFRQQDWQLIKAKQVYFNQTSGEMTDKLYDFLNRSVKQTTGNLHHRTPANIVLEDNLIFSELRTFNTFKKPWTWEITKDNFL